MPTLRSHTHWQAPQAGTQTKAYQRVCLPNAEKKKLKIPFPSKNFKNATALPTITEKPTTDKNSKLDGQERQHLTAVWRNGGCSASYDSFVVDSSAVLRIKFSAKNPPLRQAAKRCLPFRPDFSRTKIFYQDFGLTVLNRTQEKWFNWNLYFKPQCMDCFRVRHFVLGDSVLKNGWT